MTSHVLLASAGAIAVLMSVTWLISLVIHDASIVDIVWGLGFTIVAAVSAVEGQVASSRRIALAVLVGIWGMRLTIYLARRNLGHGEDKRYTNMRRRWGNHFWVVSLFQVYVLQGVLMWIVSLPVQLSASSLKSNGPGPLAVAGVLLWVVGFAFESIGDFQLARFKASRDNWGQVMDRGLWRYTRHPNYFGDFCVWWGIYLVAAETEFGRFGFIGPIVMATLLLRVSGVAMLERTIGKRRPGYADYVARTSAFFPRPPKKLPPGPADPSAAP